MAWNNHNFDGMDGMDGMDGLYYGRTSL